jgi:hypothetical protein
LDFGLLARATIKNQKSKIKNHITVAGQCRTDHVTRSTYHVDFTGLPPLCALHPGNRRTWADQYLIL